MVCAMTKQATRYSATAMLLHWGIALLLLFNFGLGERSEELRRGPELLWVMSLHKSIGISILLLSFWRLGLRLFTSRPAKAQDAGLFQMLSTAIHWGFYAVMILVPVTGWIIISTSRVQVPTFLFGVIPWPHLPNWGRDAHEAAETAHAILSKAMLPLLALHIIGAVRHQFLLKDALVERMVPARRVGALGVALLVASLGLAFVAAQNIPAPSQPQPGEPLQDFQSAQKALPAAGGPPLAANIEKP